jgi:hypothetical protein
MELYHVTSISNAESILCLGFRDSTHYGPKLIGVWLADHPTWDGGPTEIIPDGCECLVVDLRVPITELRKYEIPEYETFRQFCVPATLIRARGRVTQHSLHKKSR